MEAAYVIRHVMLVWAIYLVFATGMIAAHLWL